MFERIVIPLDIKTGFIWTIIFFMKSIPQTIFKQQVPFLFCIDVKPLPLDPFHN